MSVPHEGLAEVVLREDGRLFATAGWDHRWGTNTHEQNQIRVPLTCRRMGLSAHFFYFFFFFCRFVFSSCRVRVFDSSTLSPLAILREHTETVQCVAMAGRDQGERGLSGYVASGAKDGKVAVYQLYPDSDSDALTGASARLKHEALYAQLHQGSTPAQQQLPAPAAAKTA